MKAPLYHRRASMTRKSFFTVISAALTCFATAGHPFGHEPAYAQSGQKARFPVIIVFDHNAPFHRYEGGHPSDERALKNPEGYKYIKYIAPGVAGAVQSLEAAHGFLADHVYSAALRGFAAHLTAE